MLKQRVMTAIVLLALLLPTLFAASTWPFALLTLALIGAAGWEWGRLNGAGFAAQALGLAVALACAAALWAGWTQRTAEPLGWWLAAGAWVVGSAWALSGGPAAWARLAVPVRWALGLVLLWTAWLALAKAKSVGVNFILSVFSIVWVADICAYFGGRAFGKRKLAPSISPGKSWEGVWSGMLGAVLLGMAWVWFEREGSTQSPSLFGHLLARGGTPLLLVGVVFLTAMSVVGDLFESLVKRSAGAKDSSALLPGHGGVLDRVDALLPVFPIALALMST